MAYIVQHIVIVLCSSNLNCCLENSHKKSMIITDTTNIGLTIDMMICAWLNVLI